MKSLFEPILRKFRRRRQQPLGFPGAFGLSLFLHLLLFVVASVLVGFLEATRSDFVPRVFEFVLGPERAPEKSAAASSMNLNGNSPPRSLPHETSRRRHAANIPGETPSVEQEETTPALPKARDLTDFDEHGSAANLETLPTRPLQFAPLVEHLRRPSHPPSARPALVSFKMPVPSSQRKAILKKVKKWITANALDSSLVWEKDGQYFNLRLHHQPAPSATGLDELLVTVTTIDDGDTLSTRLRMRRLAFSQFAQFVDYWDPQVAVHDDEFDGRFHSNSALVISGSGGTQPKFRGKVTTASYSIRSDRAPVFLDREKVFLDGIEEGADRIPLPRVFLGIPRDNSHVQTFVEETWLTFHRDGRYTWRSASGPQAEHRAAPEKAPGCIIAKSKLHVKGVVKGLWLVFSENRIIIDDDVSYQQNPEIFPASNDFLGLVSAKDVEIAPPAVTGPGDLKIYAAILAKGRFRVPHLYTRQTGTLHVYGSLSAGSISATEPRYATRIRFDKRFENMRPPNFPMTNRYEITEWDERWIVK
ncbi:hypothetical protein L0337_11350 [candidate division KSB1 bacterium]|nr:hypothetical protein [candidate division KSB1 bacterium]